MGILEEYQSRFGLAQTEWTLNHWQKVAIELAKLQDSANKKKPRGRPKGSKDPDNIPALSFWAEQEIERALREDGKKITRKEAITRVMADSVRRKNEQGSKIGAYKVGAKLKSVIKQEQTFRNTRKKRK